MNAYPSSKSMELTIELADWLVSGNATAWLDQTAASFASGASTLQALASLRRQLTPPQANAVVEQILLRQDAAEKFTRAAAMWFTRQGLEQASSETIARYKADRFPAKEAVADLCCGIGGDALGLGQRGPCQVVDRDPALVRFALANCSVYETCDSVGQVADVRELDPARFPLVHFDPDRRATGRRTVQLEFFDPSLTELERWSRGTLGMAVKIAPASVIPESWSERCERQWIGHRRECKQQVLWLGKLARYPGERVASVIHANDRAEEFRGCGPAPSIPRVARPGRFIVEPHPAVRAADLSQHLAAVYALNRLDNSRRLLTAEHPFPGGLASSYETLADLPAAKPKEISALLNKMEAAKPQIKAAGAPAQLVHSLQALPASGDRPFVLIVSRINDRWRCLVTRPYSDR